MARVVTRPCIRPCRHCAASSTGMCANAVAWVEEERRLDDIPDPVDTNTAPAVIPHDGGRWAWPDTSLTGHHRDDPAFDP